MKYKAKTFYDSQLKHIDNGGHEEEFESEYHIKKGTQIRFNNLFGRFGVISVEIKPGDPVIYLLCSPDVSYF